MSASYMIVLCVPSNYGKLPTENQTRNPVKQPRQQAIDFDWVFSGS